MFKNKDILIIVFAVIAMSLPFINRAYFVDDYYHVTMAKGIIENPLRPYDFKSDDNVEQVKSWVDKDFPRMVNPPLMHYYLSAVIKCFGDQEWKLRLSAMLFAVIAVLSMYFISRRFTSYPLASALLFACSPAFFLSSYSLMIDMMMCALFFAGFECFMRGCEKDNWLYLIFAGILLGLAPMAKYPAYYTYFFVLTWFLINYYKESKKYKYLLIFIIPVFIAVVWYLWNMAMYGESHMLASYKRFGSGPMLFKLIVAIVFLSGVSICSFAYEILCLLKHKWFFLVTCVIGLIVTVIFSSPVGGFNIVQSFLIALFLMNTFTVITLVLLDANNENKFLFIWFFSGLIFVMLPIPWVAGRYYLIMLPALVILTIEMIVFHFQKLRSQIMWAVVFLCASVTIALAYADYVQAEVYRKIAVQVDQNELVKNTRGKKIVLGDTFFGYSYYLKQKGWRVIFDQSEVKKGDLLLASTQSIPAVARPKWNLNTKEIARFTFDTKYPVRVMDLPSSAGFYASAGGALPFSVSNLPIDVFVLYEVM